MIFSVEKAVVGAVVRCGSLGREKLVGRALAVSRLHAVHDLDPFVTVRLGLPLKDMNSSSHIARVSGQQLVALEISAT